MQEMMITEIKYVRVVYSMNYAYKICISRLVNSLNNTPCFCSRLAFTQPQLDFFMSEENLTLLCYLLVLRCSMCLPCIWSMPSIPYGLCDCLLVGMD